ncbi:unnamed protein product [Litomosoides sigmodontis]|uniref:Programmed cell death protein 5 n=1 Tax=Litomosoides sigmodontis TaxID=42156 RepID=A0A3P6TZN7_LITSI|nr:unnamed protein product [Litomosoides sigmodontis]
MFLSYIWLWYFWLITSLMRKFDMERMASSYVMIYSQVAMFQASDMASRVTESVKEKISDRVGNAQSNKAKEAAEREKNMKNAILSQVLDQDAMARLSNLSAAKPEKSTMVENMIVQMARRGQIMGKMNDETLRQLLTRFSENTRQTTTVKFDRRRAAIDSDSD